MNERSKLTKKTAAGVLGAGGLLMTGGGCETAVAMALIKVVLILGTTLIATGNGRLLEKILDQIFYSPEVINSEIQADYVAIDESDPLTGRYKKPVKLTVQSNRPGSVVVDEAKVKRSSPASRWEVDEQLINEIRKGAKRFDN